MLVCIFGFDCSLRGEDAHNLYGAGQGQIWLDNLGCTGTESNIANCRHNGWGIHNCDHSEDVSVACFTGKQGSGHYVLDHSDHGRLTAHSSKRDYKFSNWIYTGVWSSCHKVYTCG